MGARTGDEELIVKAFRKLVSAMRDRKPVEDVRVGPVPSLRGELPSSDTFLDGVMAAREKALRNLLGRDATTVEVAELGPFIATEDRPGTEETPLRLSEPTHVLAFPESTARFFASLTPPRIAMLSELANLTPAILAAMKITAQNHIESGIRRQVWWGALKGAGAAVALVFYLAHWGLEQAEWVVKKFPTIQELYKWVSG